MRLGLPMMRGRYSAITASSRAGVIVRDRARDSYEPVQEGLGNGPDWASENEALQEVTQSAVELRELHVTPDWDRSTGSKGGFLRPNNVIWNGQWLRMVAKETDWRICR